jgi:HSP20 family protein
MNNIMKRSGRNDAQLTPFSGFVDSVLQNSLKHFFDDDMWGSDQAPGAGKVPVNIRETDRSYEMELVAPGLNKQDFHINVSRNLLTVSFEHKEENKEEDKSTGYLRREYSMNSFSRSFNLDDTVDAEKISAQYLDGVLRLSLPKKEGAQRISRNIRVE